MKFPIVCGELDIGAGLVETVNLQVGNATYLGLLNFNHGWWLAAKFGDPIPAPLYLVHLEHESPPDAPCEDPQQS